MAYEPREPPQLRLTPILRSNPALETKAQQLHALRMEEFLRRIQRDVNQAVAGAGGGGTELWEDNGAYLNPVTDGDAVRVYNAGGISFSQLGDLILNLGGTGATAVRIDASGTTVRIYKGDGSQAANFSVPSGPTGSEQFGAGANAGTSGANNTHNTVIGYGASVNVSGGAGGGNVAIGSGAFAHSDGVAIGYNVTTGSAIRVVVIGRGASTGGQDTVAIGYNASAGNSGNIAIGSGASTGANANVVCIGSSATATGTGAIALGPSATAEIRGIAIGRATYADQDTVVIGEGAGPSAVMNGTSDAVVIGAQATISAAGYHRSVTIGSDAVGSFECVVIGNLATAGGFSECIVIGKSAAATANNQCVIGDDLAKITDVIIGRGVTDTAPEALTIRTTGASGANVAGSNLTLGSGRSTGSANGGSLILATSPAGGAGSTLNAYTTRVEITGAGGITLTPASVITVAGNAKTIDFTGTNPIIMCSQASTSMKFQMSGNTIIELKDNAATPQLGFFNTGPSARVSAYTQTYNTADKTLSAYTPDAETTIYTGMDNLQPGTPYAAVTDLEALRVAYENLRSFTEDLAQFVNSIVDDLQTYGLFQ